MAWMLLWLWRRLAAAAPIRPLAWEPPYAAGATLKRQKKLLIPCRVGTHPSLRAYFCLQGMMRLALHRSFQISRAQLIIDPSETSKVERSGAGDSAESSCKQRQRRACGDAAHPSP